MKLNIIRLILLGIFLLALACGGSKPTREPLNSSTLKTIEADLAKYGEGRWHNWEAEYDIEGETLILKIAADPSANEKALASYCGMLKAVAKDNAPDYPYLGYIFVLGEIREKC